jgi:hypothetical protein
MMPQHDNFYDVYSKAKKSRSMAAWGEAGGSFGRKFGGVDGNTESEA